ncbi:1064_t:CDS:2 [Diversispora eburnea]|uniref:1064_t:CDS:1 n=1 Tax=Diversispora eburnea TaxID=1213867 RepID=A0A9N8WAA5_9GLOM|nr:1064_t:CDS:2 [Diversispora eburnea]
MEVSEGGKGDMWRGDRECGGGDEDRGMECRWNVGECRLSVGGM